jgi:hypothetical protein
MTQRTARGAGVIAVRLLGRLICRFMARDCGVDIGSSRRHRERRHGRHGPHHASEQAQQYEGKKAMSEEFHGAVQWALIIG